MTTLQLAKIWRVDLWSFRTNIHLMCNVIIADLQNSSHNARSSKKYIVMALCTVSYCLSISWPWADFFFKDVTIRPFFSSWKIPKIAIFNTILIHFTPFSINKSKLKTDSKWLQSKNGQKEIKVNWNFLPFLKVFCCWINFNLMPFCSENANQSALQKLQYLDSFKASLKAIFDAFPVAIFVAKKAFSCKLANDFLL